MKPLQGKDGILRFYKGNDFVDFGCAETFSVEFGGDTKSVKTKGDGPWKRTRKQNLGYVISVNGIIPYDDDTVSTAFDLLDYYLNMEDVRFQIVFYQEDQQIFKVIQGFCSVDSINIESPSDFITGTLELTGQGEPEFSTIADVCIRTIPEGEVDADQQADPAVFKITVQNIEGGQPWRYDYSFDQGPRETSLYGHWDISGVTIGVHELRIWPVCDNGVDGDLFTMEITRTS